MDKINIEWLDVEKKLEEEEFKKEKGEQYKKQIIDSAPKKDTASAKSSENTENESLGLAALIGETWNEIVVSKGYESVTDKQLTFLNNHTQKLEQKYLNDKQNIMPEIDALLSHVVVYLPKIIKHKTIKKE